MAADARPVEAGAAAAGRSTADAAETVPQLPDAVIDNILQWVPLRTRMYTCARVCKTWAAVARSTRSLQVELKPGPSAAVRLPLLQSWLAHTEQQLTSLYIYPRWLLPVYMTLGTLQLPCGRLTRLQELNLTSLNVGLPAAVPLPLRPDADRAAEPAAAPSSASAETLTALSRRPLLPALQCLYLNRCTLGTCADLLHLASSPALTSLVIHEISIRGAGGTTRSSGASTLNQGLFSLLEQLPRLNQLYLKHNELQLTTLNSLTAMQSLQDLTVCLETVHSTALWPCSMPAGLTRLLVYVKEVFDAGAAGPSGVWPVAATAQWLSSNQLTQLQELQLTNCKLDPVTLDSSAGLRTLCVSQCRLVPGAQDGVRALLSSLGRLTQLQHVDLLHEPGSVQGLAPELFAALTASQQLTCLKFSTYFEQPLPLDAVRYMFPAGCCMPQLNQLSIERQFHPEQEGGGDKRGDWCLHDEDLCSIARACPRLQQLALGRVVQPGASFSALQLLPPSLTGLVIGGPAFGDAAAAAVAQLKQLRSFEWDCAPDLSDLGFQHLTALTALTRLSANSCAARYRAPISLSDDLFKGTANPFRKTLDLSESDDKGPVWQQVQAMCSNSPACARELRRQAAFRQEQLEALRQKQRQELEALQGQLGHQIEALRQRQEQELEALRRRQELEVLMQRFSAMMFLPSRDPQQQLGAQPGVPEQGPAVTALQAAAATCTVQDAGAESPGSEYYSAAESSGSEYCSLAESDTEADQDDS